ncbi:hypothetical protein F511_03881 [Dorcoceras hygrometricum]|uniref:Uncharacterized protein n=1 Tax=Dorcoceras hygrometricum TaxID=472368 RepID=A0A2Z7AXD4_9LAMI|nr:hypothetical protein F511_03881 [Dorcoceras hygrometricum]
MSLLDLQDVCMAIGSIATLDLPMVVDLIGIYGLKGPYRTLTTTDWFLQALSVIPRGSWGDVARRFTMIRWASPEFASRPFPPLQTPPPPPAVRRRRRPPCRRKFVSGQLDEENPFVQNSSVLIVQPDEGVSILVVDRIGDYLPQSTEKSRILVIPVGARHKCQQGFKELSEIPKDVVFDAKSIVSLSGEPVSTSGKKKAMKLEFRLLCDIMAKTISVKAGSFDSLTQEKFQMITAVTCGVKVNWSSVKFNILKNMVTPATRQAKGYAIQISLLLENVQNLELGESSEFPSSKIMTEKTVHRYIAVTDKVSAENVADVPKVKRTPVKKAVSKKRPAADDAEAEPVVKKKRTSKGKPVSSKDTLEIVAVAQEAVPIQIVEATTAAPAEQPPAHKRKSQKRKRRLVMPQDSDYDVLEQPVVEGAEVTEPAVGTVSVYPVVEKSPVVELAESAAAHIVDPVVDPAVDPVVAEIVVEPVVETFPSDDVDNIIQQVLVETAQLGATETNDGAPETQEAAVEQHWFDLPYEDIIAQLNDRPVVTPSDTDEEVGTMDVGTDGGDQQVQNFVEEPEDEEMSSDDEQSVAERIDADEAMSLEDILYSIPVDVPLPSAGVEITKITLGKEIKIPEIDERTWYLASLPKIPVDDKGKKPLMQKDPIKGKPPQEHYSLICADIDLLTLAHGLRWDRTCCSWIFEGRPRDRGAVIARNNTNTPSKCWIRTMILVDGVWVIEPCCDQWVKIPQPVVHNEVPRQLSYVDTLPAVSDFVKILRKIWADVCVEAAESCVSEKLLPVGSINFCRALSVVEPVDIFIARQPTVFSLRLSQFCTVFIRYSLFSRLSTVDITSFFASIASARTVLRSVQNTSSSAVSQYIPSVADTEFVAQRIPMELDHRPFLSSISDASDMHFDETDIATTVPSLPAITTDLSASLDDLQTFLSERINESQSDILSKLHTIGRGLRDSLQQQYEAFRILIQGARQEGQTIDDVQTLRFNEFRKGVLVGWSGSAPRSGSGRTKL